LVLAR